MQPYLSQPLLCNVLTKRKRGHQGPIAGKGQINNLVWKNGVETAAFPAVREPHGQSAIVMSFTATVTSSASIHRLWTLPLYRKASCSLSVCAINFPFFTLYFSFLLLLCYCNPLGSFVADSESSEVFQDTWVSSLSKLSKGFLQDCIYNFFAKPEHKYYAIVLNTLSFFKGTGGSLCCAVWNYYVTMFACLQWVIEKFMSIFKRCVSAEGPAEEGMVHSSNHFFPILRFLLVFLNVNKKEKNLCNSFFLSGIVKKQFSYFPLYCLITTHLKICQWEKQFNKSLTFVHKKPIH